MSTTKGMRLSVYRSGSCCTNGPSATERSITLIGEGVPEIFEPTEDAPAMFLTRTHDRFPPIIVPEASPPPMQYSAGGNFAWSSDSRFRELVMELTGGTHDGPIAIHDRNESKMTNELRALYYTAKLDFRSGEVEWTMIVAFSVTGVVHDLAAIDFIAAHTAEKMERDGGAWISSDGCLSVTPKVCRQIPKESFETLVKNGVDRHDVTQATYEAWVTERGDIDASVIYSPNEAALSNDDGGYWSNEDGWSGLESATRYTPSDVAMIRPHRMPITTGRDARFVPAVRL